VAPVPGHRRRAAGTAWALSFLATLASVVFAMGSIAGWILGAWPASPLTLAVAAVVVLGGPLGAAALSRSARPGPAPSARMRVVARAPAPPRPPQPRQAPRRELVHAAPAPLPLTPEQAWGQQLLDWRDRPRQRQR
jgi:hypothetical protein